MITDKDYRKSNPGIRRFSDKETYAKSLEFQYFLKTKGIAWHNTFADECTIDFCCCEGDGEYKLHLPSYYSSAKQLFSELFEQIKPIDKEGQNLLKSKMDSFLSKEVLWNEP